MTRAYAATDVLTLPGEIPGLLTGWCGPVEGRTIVRPGYGHTEPVWGWVIEPHAGRGEHRRRGGFRLPLSRPEAVYRAACWLAEGERCPTCEGYCVSRGGGIDCRECKNAGFLRAPAPLWWALPGPSTLPGWVCRAVVHASVTRVAAGETPLTGVWIPSGERVAGPGDFRINVADLSPYALLDGDTLRIDLPDTPAAPGGETP